MWYVEIGSGERRRPVDSIAELRRAMVEARAAEPSELELEDTSEPRPGLGRFLRRFVLGEPRELTACSCSVFYRGDRAIVTFTDDAGGEDRAESATVDDGEEPFEIETRYGPTWVRPRDFVPRELAERALEEFFESRVPPRWLPCRHTD